jgi:exodeoxyribonuclease V alpha subunit
MELKAIIDFAATINRGDSDSVIETLTGSNSNSGISRLSLKGEHSHPKAAQQDLIAHISPHFHKPLLNKENHRQLLEAFQHFRLLSPLRKGPFGIDELNRLIYAHFIKKMRHQPWFCAPIMLTSNDHRLELFNGEVGVLVRHGDGNDSGSQHLKEEDFALFLDSSGEQGNAIRKLPALILPKYEYAYCLSVHKSQGSEFDHVLLMLPEGAERFGREVLYTAATRARKRLEVWGSDHVLREATLRQASRLSGVVSRLVDLN